VKDKDLREEMKRKKSVWWVMKTSVPNLDLRFQIFHLHYTSHIITTSLS